MSDTGLTTGETKMKTAIRITTTGDVTTLDISTDTLAQLQQAVGGLVQAIDLTERLTLWCNEEGKLLEQAHNPYAQYFWDKMFGAYTDYMVGDVVFTGGTDDNGNTLGITEDAVEWLLFFVGKVREVVEPSIKVLS